MGLVCSGAMDPAIAAAIPPVGLIEVLAMAGAFLYGTVTVVMVTLVAKDRREKLADDVLSIT